MATTEELEKEILAEMAADPVAYAAGPVDDIITIDGETRVISVPASEILFGVETDKDVERKHFRCPKIVGDGIDLSKHQIYISYITSDSTGKSFSGDSNLYLCEDVAIDGDDVIFSWQLSGNVFASAGFIAFKVLAAKTDGENVQTRWNTVPAVGTVLMTVPDGMDISETYPDIVTQLLERMESVEKIATEEAMQGYVNTYLEAHPADIDETLTDHKKAAPADVVGKLKEDLRDIGIDCISTSVVSNGYFVENGGDASDDTCRRTDYIEFDKNEFIILKYIFNDGYMWCGYQLYDANKTIIGKRVVFTSEANRVVKIYPTKDTRYIRFTWSVTNIVSIAASLYEKTGYSDVKIEVVKKNLLEEIHNVENDTLTVSQGYIPIKLIADKFLTSSGIAGYTNWSATENIKVEGLDCIYTEWSKASSYNKFLDSSFGLVKMVTIKDGLQKTNVPEGSCYVAFSNETTVMKGLKVWTPTKINSYENTLEISKLKQDIPFYYEKHLSDKITEVRAKETFSGVSGDEFIFITDYHMERNANNSPSLIDKIIHQTGAKKIVFGGDAYDASSAPDLALNKIADFYSMFYENADKILSCVGNHEYNNPASNKPEQQIPNGQVYASIVNRNDLIHHSRHTCNYTILNRSNETMYIFIGCEYSSSVTDESIKYVLETIKNNNGYDIIVFSHTGLDNGGDNGNVANIIDGFKRITDGIDKFNQKSNYIFDGITYDYSGCTGEVICVFSGHNHVDGCIRTDGGLNVISTTCDAYGAPEGGVVRTKGTITEQAFDVVNIDYENKKIYMTRIGAGEDRVFSY